MPSIAKQLEQLQVKKDKLLAHQDKLRANKTFVCLCGHRHQIKECVVIQTHWYTLPSGCTDGDYWSEGELQIVCFDTDKKNRVLFDDYDMPWEKRRMYEHSANTQFSHMYRHLFKEVIQDYKEDDRAWVNSYYFDQHRAKFELCAKFKKDKE
jgi:hypothetical protein